MSQESPFQLHQRRAQSLRLEADAHNSRSIQLAVMNLVLALATIVLLITSLATSELLWGLSALLTGSGFVVVRMIQARSIAARDWAEVRQAIHERHAARAVGDWKKFDCDVAIAQDHPFALDLDLVGQTSLLQRIDITQTVQGEQILLRWLSEAAPPEEIAERQQAVRELSAKLDLREQLEAAGRFARKGGKLDEKPFLQFVGEAGYFEAHPALPWVATVAPLLTVSLTVLAYLGVLSPLLPVLAVGAQAVITVVTGGRVHQRFDLVAARRGFAESFQHLLRSIEHANFEAPLLKRLREQLSQDGIAPSQQFAGLDRWAGFSDLRYQVLAHLPINWLVLWDLHVLGALERWTRLHKKDFPVLFETVGTLEALSSLATLLAVDGSATIPEISKDPSVGIEADAVVHPLLQQETRVANSLSIPGPGSALIVTGSNMAGKSTLLRAVGLNLALALAGGPVCAERWRCSPVRIRASMRAEDDLGQGASYFHAELKKLRGVVGSADSTPPIFFLLDELLRGTNARARHVGARAVIEHLLERGAYGMVATHDVQLGEMEQERPEMVHNVHFTDVVVDGEMTFDYRLRPGVVKTSNALRLLQLAGIDVDTELMETADGAAPALPDSSSHA